MPQVNCLQWTNRQTDDLELFSLGKHVSIKATCLSIDLDLLRLIESTTTLYRDRELHLSVKDLQSTTTSQGLPSCRCCISLTRGWISLSLNKVVVDYFPPIPLNSCKKPPYFSLEITTERFPIIKLRQLDVA